MTTKRGGKDVKKSPRGRAQKARAAAPGRAARARKTSTKSAAASTASKGSKGGAAKKGRGATPAAPAVVATSSARTSVSEAHLELIVQRIAGNACVPFLGAAANVTNDALRYKGLPLGTDVAKALIKKLPDFTGRDLLNLARITLEYEFEVVERSFFVEQLHKILHDKKCKPSPLLRTLARLPFKTIITTNYDRLLEKALAERKVPFQTLVQPQAGWNVTNRVKQRFEELDVYKGLVLYKIHGSFDLPQGEEPPPSLIITEDDYIDFLTILGREKEKIGIPNFIIKRIVGSTLLFLGYSLEDWDFRTIYKGWIESLPKHQGRVSFAFQKDPPAFWVEFWRKKGVVIYNVDLYEFADQLRERYAAATRGRGARREGPSGRGRKE